MDPESPGAPNLKTLNLKNLCRTEASGQAGDAGSLLQMHHYDQAGDRNIAFLLGLGLLRIKIGALTIITYTVLFWGVPYYLMIKAPVVAGLKGWRALGFSVRGSDVVCLDATFGFLIAG